MRRARILVNGVAAGTLEELIPATSYIFRYDEGYGGQAISLTMPTSERVYEFRNLPPFFDGLLPEGFQLDALVRLKKIDRNDYFSQLVAVGEDLVGWITVEEIV